MTFDENSTDKIRQKPPGLQPARDTRSKLVVHSANVNGLRSKIDEVRLRCHEDSIDVFLLQETKLCRSIRNIELAIFPGIDYSEMTERLMVGARPPLHQKDGPGSLHCAF